MDRVLSFLSLATKAGKTASGEFATEKAVKDGRAFLVITAADASDNTKKHFKDMCAYRSIPFRIYSDKEKLGMACGKEYRAQVAICDKGFSDNMIRLLTEVEI